MSALAEKRTFRDFRTTSALPPKADIAKHGWDACFVPKAVSYTLQRSTFPASSFDLRGETSLLCLASHF
jgi:hypothetical protein